MEQILAPLANITVYLVQPEGIRAKDVYRSVHGMFNISFFIFPISPLLDRVWKKKFENKDNIY